LPRLFLLASLPLAVSCTHQEPTDLSVLQVVDSVYVAPATAEPFTGSVVRHFAAQPDEVQLKGTLRDGVFDGELVVYHPNGRVRFMGSFRAGERCGSWTENADSSATGSLHQILRREVETLGLYPACEGEETG